MYDEERPYTEVVDEPTQSERKGYWEVASRLQLCDGLLVSDYAQSVGQRYVEGEIGSKTVQKEISSYYQSEKPVGRQAEADIVAARITSLLESSSFILSAGTLLGIHSFLFSDVLPKEWVGCFRETNLTKPESVLGGRSLVYADYRSLPATVAYDLDNEKRHRYSAEFDDGSIKHFARFISNVWQSHPFKEGNTRTAAVFSELYLRSMGINVANEMFAQNAQYFRDALVRASYASIKDGIEENPTYIEQFYRAVIRDEKIDFSKIDMNVHGVRVNDTPYRNSI